jgi:hypothetical protein
MMKLRAVHDFMGLTLESYETLYFSEDFNKGLCESVALERTLNKLEDDGKLIERVVTVCPDRTIPAPLAKVLKTDKIEYQEILTYHRGKFIGQWKTVPPFMSEKFLASGEFRFEAIDGGVRRIMEGDITVKIFGVGGLAEKVIVSEVEASYDRAAEFTRDYLKRHPEFLK